jgi:hypothetical protein
VTQSSSPSHFSAKLHFARGPFRAVYRAFIAISRAMARVPSSNEYAEQEQSRRAAFEAFVFARHSSFAAFGDYHAHYGVVLKVLSGPKLVPAELDETMRK